MSVAPSTEVLRRRRAALVVGAAAVLLLAAVLVVRACGGGSDTPPRADAAKIAPNNTLVLADLSTDGEREAVQRAGELLERFDGYEGQRNAILRRLSGADREVDIEKDVLPWLGDEAALALTDMGTATAGSLVMIAVSDEERAREFMSRTPNRTARGEYKDDPYEEFGRLTVAIKDGWLLIGQSGTVRAGLDGVNGRSPGLAAEQLYKRAIDGLPDGRVATVYASAAGLRRLLVPQAGLLGGLSVLFDQPSLESVAVAFGAEDDGAKATVHSALNADAKRASGEGKPFSPSLHTEVPRDALAYYGLNGIAGPLARVLTASVSGASAGGLGPALARLQQELQKRTSGRLQRDLLDLFEGEVAFTVLKSIPAPSLSVIAKTEDEDATAQTLAELEPSIARLLRARSEGEAPKWSERDLGDAVTAHTLTLPTGASLSYAVFEERLVLSTSADAIKRIKDADEALGDADAFEEVTEGRPDEVGSLGFLDFSQLLELGEQTGLNEDRAYLAARDDLQKIRAVGISSTGGEEETTAEIRLSIP